MATITLTALPRDSKKKAKELRRAGQVPGVVYGPKTKNISIECKYQELHKAYVAAGESTIVELSVEGKNIPVLIHQLHFDPMTGDYEHIDFFALDMTKEVTTNVPIRTIGEAPGVKELGGVLIKNKDHVTVKCLPKDLPHDIEVDLSKLVNFYDAVTVGSLSVPKGVKILDEAEEILVSIAPPRKEEEETPVVAAVAEGEVAAAGEAAAAGAAGEAKKEEVVEKKKEKKK